MKSLGNVLILLVAALALNQAASGQKTWNKSWKQWNRDDVLKILYNSPWAYSYGDIEIVAQTSGLNSSTNTSIGAASPQIVVRLYSAVTVQRALLRSSQLDAKYDSMTDRQKAEFDERTKGFLNCANCKNYYIVVLLQPSEKNARTLIGTRFKGNKLEDVKGGIYLSNEKGEKRELAQFAAPQTESGSAVFYFDRFNADRKPLITRDSKKLSVIFKLRKNDSRKDFLQDKIEFDVSKMVIDGEVDF